MLLYKQPPKRLRLKHLFRSPAAITINGGTFSGEATDSGAIWNKGSIQVNGGTFNYIQIDNEHSIENVQIASGINVTVVQEGVTNGQ